MHTSSTGVAQFGAFTVIRMTLERHRRIVLAGSVALASIAPACASNDPTAAPSITTAPAPVDASAPDTEPEGSTQSPPSPPACTLAGPPTASAGESLVWSDEFSGDTIDTTKWYVHTAYEGRGDILNSFSRDAISVHDGSLYVTASATPDDPVHPYRSGRLDTFGRFSRTYGKLEFRARFPSAPGVWYALWGRPSTALFPEMDVEILGNDASQVWLVNHWAGEPLPADQRRKYVTVDKVDVTAFHVYSVVWKPSHLEWQIDGTPYLQSTDVGVPTTPVSWTINGWVGGWGRTDLPPAVPATFEVDYIRVYRLDGLIAEPTIRVMNPRAQYSAQSDSMDVEPANFDEACFHVEVYEGDSLLETLRPWPYRFRPTSLSPGRHVLTFVATDGARRAVTELDAEIL
jgi:beta-glucanase (GH16 family)